MVARVTLVATLDAGSFSQGPQLSRFTRDLDCLEVRADQIGDPDPQWLRDRFPGHLIYTLRSTNEGGAFQGSGEERSKRLLRAAGCYDLIDLEGARDLSNKLLAVIPPHKRLISWHGTATHLADLRARFQQLSTVPAGLYKLVPLASRSGDELAPLLLLKTLNRSDTLAFAAGPVGFWSRLLAPHLGAPVVFGTLTTAASAQGEPGIRQLIDDYGYPQWHPVRHIYGIVGNPVLQSRSPLIHNAGYRALAWPALYLPFHVEDFSAFWNVVVVGGTMERLGLSVAGLTVVSPFKEATFTRVDSASSVVQCANAGNLLRRANDTWVAETTDPDGVRLGLQERGIPMRGRRAAVVGCGGAGRAIAVALKQAGAHVTLVNRATQRGEYAMRLLQLPFIPLARFNVAEFSIVINATPVGRDEDEVPFALEKTRHDAVIVDLVYRATPTLLMSKALAKGRTAISGHDILRIQALRQFQRMTGYEMPREAAQECFGLPGPAVSAASPVG